MGSVSDRERRKRKFEIQRGICHWCKQLMTLDRGRGGRPVKNFATFGHVQRKRHGGKGKHNNVVLACYYCNHKREVGKQTSKPKSENIAARRLKDQEILERLRNGTLNAAERGELYTRGLVPNWPMWSKYMASV